MLESIEISKASRLNDEDRLHKPSVYYRVIIAPGPRSRDIEERGVGGGGIEATWVALAQSYG